MSVWPRPPSIYDALIAGLKGLGASHQDATACVARLALSRRHAAPGTGFWADAASLEAKDLAGLMDEVERRARAYGALEGGDSPPAIVLQAPYRDEPDIEADAAWDGRYLAETLARQEKEAAETRRQEEREGRLPMVWRQAGRAGRP